MSEILDFKAKSEPPRSKFGKDQPWLELCAEWRIKRAEQQRIWAEKDKLTTFAFSDGDQPAIDLGPVSEMENLQDLLATIEPKTMLLARELLRICVTILAHQHEDPEGRLGDGPVLEIMRNVVESLEYCPADTKIGKGNKTN